MFLVLALVESVCHCVAEQNGPGIPPIKKDVRDFAFRLPSALERPHVVEELVIEMEVRELRVGQGNGGALDQDRDNLGRSRVVSPLSSQGVLDLLGNPL